MGRGAGLRLAVAGHSILYAESDATGLPRWPRPGLVIADNDVIGRRRHRRAGIDRYRLSHLARAAASSLKASSIVLNDCVEVCLTEAFFLMSLWTISHVKPWRVDPTRVTTTRYSGTGSKYADRLDFAIYAACCHS
jgi:hypothetical protein